MLFGDSEITCFSAGGPFSYNEMPKCKSKGMYYMRSQHTSQNYRCTARYIPRDTYSATRTMFGTHGCQPSELVYERDGWEPSFVSRVRMF